MKKNKTHHIHKYVRTKMGPKSTVEVYRCILPGCPHYLHLPMLVGRLAECHKCEQPFIVNGKQATRKKPCCTKCMNKSERRGYAHPDIVDKAPRDENGRYKKLTSELEQILLTTKDE